MAGGAVVAFEGEAGLATDLSRIDAHARQKLFDPDGDLSTTLLAIWAEIEGEAEEIASIFWRLFRRNPAVRAAVPDAALADAVAKSISYTRRKFTAPIDEHWVERVAEQGDICVDLDVPGRELIAAVEASYEHGLRHLFARKAGDPAFLTEAVVALQRLTALEHELWLTRITVRQKRAELDRLGRQAEMFRSRVLTAVERLEGASAGVRARAAATSDAAGRMLALSADVTVAATQSAGAMHDAAGNTAAMARAVDAVRLDAEGLDELAQAAHRDAVQAAEAVRVQARSSEAIDSIVGVIRDIAGQTNMLALNATIEAARAGEAGRGFAVVAQEVKNLASQTARATAAVAEQIEAIKQGAKRTVEAGEAIGATVSTVSDSAQRMRGRLEVQADAVLSIGRLVDETATSAGQVSDVMSQVRVAAEGVSSEMAETDAAVHTVDGQLATLRRELVEFLGTIRAA